MKDIETHDLAYATYLRVSGYEQIESWHDAGGRCHWVFLVPEGSDPWVEWVTGAKVPANAYAQTLRAMKREALGGR